LVAVQFTNFGHCHSASDGYQTSHTYSHCHINAAAVYAKSSDADTVSPTDGYSESIADNDTDSDDNIQ
jgi:hypothetical protein